MKTTTIKRRQFIKLSGLTATALTLPGCQPDSTSSDETATGNKLSEDTTAPNILFICVDQLRSFKYIPDSLPLPNLRRLKESSVSFDNHRATTSPCGPSRSVMYTGQHVTQTGVIDNPNLGFVTLDTTVPTIGHYLRSLGYTTAYKGKWHLSKMDSEHTPADILENYGFSDFSTFGDKHGESNTTGFEFDPQIAQDAGDWINQVAPENTPWFLAVNLVNPHDIMFHSTGSNQQDSQLNPDFIAPVEPNTLYEEIDWGIPLPNSFYQHNVEQELEANTNWRQLTQLMFGQIPLDDENAWYDFQNQYFRCVIEVDKAIGHVLDSIENSPFADNTVVVFTSDHGELAGAHGLRSKEGCSFDEAMSVPLFIKAPNQDMGQRYNGVSSHLDIVPTILAFAGADKHSQQQFAPALKGYNLAGLVDSHYTSGDIRLNALLMQTCLHEIDKDIGALVMSGGLSLEKIRKIADVLPAPKLLDEHNFFRGVVDQQYKFCRYFRAIHHHAASTWEVLVENNQLELYDIINDPEELINLALQPERYQTLIMTMNDKLEQIIAAEIGEDLGAHMPGPRAIWQLNNT